MLLIRNVWIDKLAAKANVEKDSSDYDKFCYGANVIIMNIPKFAILLILAMVLRVTENVMVFMVVYGALRLFSYGMHLESPVLCTLLGLAYYLGSAVISSLTLLSYWGMGVIFVFGSIVFYFYAPGETKKRPFSVRERKRFKALSVILLFIIELLAIEAYQSYPVGSNLICCAIVSQCINLLPITFKIVRRLENEKIS